MAVGCRRCRSPVATHCSAHDAAAPGNSLSLLLCSIRSVVAAMHMHVPLLHLCSSRQDLAWPESRGETKPEIG